MDLRFYKFFRFRLKLAKPNRILFFRKCTNLPPVIGSPSPLPKTITPQHDLLALYLVKRPTDFGFCSR